MSAWREGVCRTERPGEDPCHAVARAVNVTRPPKNPAGRRELILASAVEEFARTGCASASTNRIAQRAKVSKGLLFRYFASKEGLFEAALDAACDLLFAPEGEPLPAEPSARLEEHLARRASRIADHPVHARLVAQSLGPGRWTAWPAARRIDEAYERLRRDLKLGTDTRSFRYDIDPEAALDLLGLVAEGLERKLLRSLDSRIPGGSPPDPPSGLRARSFDPESVREEVRVVWAMLKKGIYRRGIAVPAKPAGDPARPTGDPSRSTGVPPRPTGDPSRPTGEPARPTGGPSRPTGGPSRPTGEPPAGARSTGAPAVNVQPAAARSAPEGAARDDRRERILLAAGELFAERGYEATSAEAIASRAGVAKGLVFHHFGSKAGLYLAAFTDAVARISAEFFQDAEPTSPDLFERLSSWTRRKMSILAARPTLYKLVFSAVADPPEPVRATLGRNVAEGISESWALIMDGIDTAPFRPEVEPARAVELVMTVVDTVSDRWMARLRDDPRLGLDLLPRITGEIDVYLELLRDGLCP